MPILPLANPLKHYAWGDKCFIPRLLGLTSQTTAELWIGAHRQSPSRVSPAARELPLDGYIAANRTAALGDAAGIYQGQLPFLLKVLAAARPLSIQAHPNLAQAADGFRRENERGIALDSETRSYRDDNHKPELVVALTPFRALCGFRAPDELRGNFHQAGLTRFFRSLNKAPAKSGSLDYRLFMREALSLDGKLRQTVQKALLNSLDGPTSLSPELAETCRELSAHFPGDPGVISPLYLSYYQLQPGEALFLRPGILHAYLQGAAIELMANSDNVLRGGLTPKHIDKTELLRVLDFSARTGLRAAAEEVSGGWVDYSCPAREFLLRRLDAEAGYSARLHTRKLPAILFCEQGSFTVSARSSIHILKRGQAAFLTASVGAYTLAGAGRLWLATVPTAN